MSDNTLPKSLPIHPSASRFLHDVSPRDYTKYYTQIQVHLESAWKRLIDSSLEDNDECPIEVMSKLAHANDEMNELNEQSLLKSKILAKSKDKYRFDSNKSHPVQSLLDWQKYVEGNEESDWHIPKPWPVHYEECKKEVISQNKKKSVDNNEYVVSEKEKLNVMAKVLPQIWNDPTAVIQDDSANDNEDELKIEGGTIELICPITVKQFEHPMISMKCGHTFDQSGISNYFGSGQTHTAKDCPQTGCGKKLSMSDFKPDVIMQMRCKIADVLKRREQQNPPDDVLDVL